MSVSNNLEEDLPFSVKTFLFEMRCRVDLQYLYVTTWWHKST